MKKITVAILSAGVLASAYFIAFGVPKQLALLGNDATPVENSASQGRGPGGPPGGPSGPGGPGGRGGRGGATTVVLAPLEEREHIITLHTVGSAVSLQQTEVMATEAGEIVEAALKANSQVKKGDVLLRLDDRTERLSLEIAETNRDQAQATVSRYEELSNAGSAVVTDVALFEAKIALRLAQANVELAELALENRTIIAPISGRIGLSNINAGDHLSAGELIVTIDDSSTLLATFEVPEKSIGLLAEGVPVFVTTPTYVGRVFEGVVTAFDSRLDSVTRSVTVEAEIDNSEGLLLPGMTFATRMFDEIEPLPVIQATAITWNRSGAGIWVVEEGKANRVPIAIRYRDGDQVWIETEASIGAQIAIEGASKLRNGAQVVSAQSEEG